MSKRERKQADNFFMDLSMDIEPAPLSEADKALYGALEGLPSLTPEQAIVAKQNGVVEIGPFRMTSTGLEIDGEITEEQWLTFFQAINRITQSLQWIIGDWMVYGEMRLGKTYKQVADEIGVAARTLEDYAYVARKVPYSVRTEYLSFGHHKLVASMPEPQQQAWLQHAQKNDLSVSVLRRELNELPPPPSGDPTGYKNFSKKARTVSKKIAAVGQGKRLSKSERQEVLGYIETMRQWLNAAEHLIGDD